MKWHSLGGNDLARAIGVDVAVSVLTAAFMAATMRVGVSPLPKPLGLAFAKAILRRHVPLPIGLLFHTIWVTAFSVAYVGLFRDELTFGRALCLAAGLWILVLALFFPIVGWGFFGLAVSPKLIVGSAVPHLLFASFLWGLCRLVFKETRLPVSRSAG
jgi:hypothetical protein